MNTFQLRRLRVRFIRHVLLVVVPFGFNDREIESFFASPLPHVLGPYPLKLVLQMRYYERSQQNHNANRAQTLHGFPE